MFKKSITDKKEIYVANNYLKNDMFGWQTGLPLPIKVNVKACKSFASQLSDMLFTIPQLLHTPNITF